MTYSQSQFQAYTRKVYKHLHITRKAKRRMERMIQCASSDRARRNNRIFRRHLKQRRAAFGIWQVRFMALNPDDRAWAKRTGACESGNNPATNTGNGFSGAMQWTLSTWRAAGGKVHPTKACIYEHWVRGVRWRDKAGANQWPVCGH